MDNDKVFQFKEEVKKPKVKPKRLTATEKNKLRKAFHAFLESEKAPGVEGFPSGVTIKKSCTDFYPYTSFDDKKIKAWADYTAYYHDPKAPHIEIRYTSSCEILFSYEFTDGGVNLILESHTWELPDDEEDEEEEDDEDEEDL